MRQLPDVRVVAAMFILALGMAASASSIRLSQLDMPLGRLSTASQGKPARTNMTVDMNTLTIAGTIFSDGIGLHAPSLMSFALDGKVSHFTALVGVDDEDATMPGSVEFIILGDEQELWRSGVMKKGQQALKAEVSLTGIKQLELHVTDGGDGSMGDHANWCNAVFVYDGELPQATTPERTLYAIGYAHLDTQWRWDYVTTSDQYLKNTLDDNFARFEKFPEYVFNFTGSRRYQLMAEFYPVRFQRLRQYIASGQWCVSGSSVDEGDVNVPSPESIIRQVLYGNEYFRAEFGKESEDFMLPDCFGFPASMPSIWAHCGLKGFSSQKLTWGSAVGMPFNIGVWEGPDGKSIIAALNPGEYVGSIGGQVNADGNWATRIEENGRKYGLHADYHYYGVGDMGGAPREGDVGRYVESSKSGEGNYRVRLTSSDQMYKDITPEMKARLPRYKGDLLLIEHSAGTLTSQSYMKRWNRKNEQLADAAERAAVLADWLGGAPYPHDKLRKAWELVLASQMHDILPGTSIPKAYDYSWNDEIVSLNRFAAVLTDSIGAIASDMDTRAEGTSIVVYNPLAIQRSDLVEMTFGETSSTSLRVFGPDGNEVPSQATRQPNGTWALLFKARVPANGLVAYDVRSAETPFEEPGPVTITDRVMENEKYCVTLNDQGDITSITDKSAANRELLSEPARLEFLHENPAQWPAWNMDWADRNQPPVGYVDGKATIEILEQGPLRVSLRITREARESVFVQDIRLAAGGECVEIKNSIDWRSESCSLKAAFPLAVTNDVATYNLGLGTIERATNVPNKYEVPSHEWFDLTDTNGNYGVTILEDSKFGSDKPSANKLRLTLLYTPGTRGGYPDQYSQDWGRHDITYAIYGHKGDHRSGNSEWQGRRLNQPLVAFRSPSHIGSLGRSISQLTINTDQVDVRTVKKAQEGEAVIVRLQELHGKPASGIILEMLGSIKSAYEVDGQERKIGPATLEGGQLKVDMDSFGIRSFALTLASPARSTKPPSSTAVNLAFTDDIISFDNNRGDGDGLDHEKRTIPGEEWPERIVTEGISFTLGKAADGEKNALSCTGQAIELPKGNYDCVYILAAASGKDTFGEFAVASGAAKLPIPLWTGFIGQFDNRVWGDGDRVRDMSSGYIKRATVAWTANHRHHPDRNETYQYAYLFVYRLPLANGDGELILPNDPSIKLMAATLVKNDHGEVVPVQALYDDFSSRPPIAMKAASPIK